MATLAVKTRARRAAAKPPVVEAPKARTIESRLGDPKNARAIGAIEALQEMQRGAVVRRIDPTGSAARFHRVRDGEVQTADNEQHLVDGNWHRTKTDIASWYGSTFLLVRIKVSIVELDYA